ncbi:uncharacterized protein LOC111027486 [Myzus persicae]|uniref:uncharacterized protein LOC111027486 n=1 Tax=Myzus persicae TaxID=13164 RepID=UPI000B93740D|nr:uncharacterized protein LOC111027486 [Myzus persicae]
MSQIIKKSKGKSCTTSQKEAIVDFIKLHPELNKGKFTQNFTKKHSQALWQELAKHLHTLVGAVKTPQQWRKCWIDMKCNAKTKSVQVKKSFKTTGGGENEFPDGLDTLEEDIVHLIGQVPINGQPHTEEPLIVFEGYNMDIMTIENNETVKFTGNETSLGEDLNIVYESNAHDGENYDENYICTALDTSVQPNVEKVETVTTKLRKIDALKKSLDKTGNLESISVERNNLLKNYYDRKLLLMERQTNALEKIANKNCSCSVNVMPMKM